ncbi:(2Fe-2S)-binding protein [Sulfodiicoccus acidiphilus]|uniref:(2Fe-2S)-binding protein n=1 Tax=Sulfodiicoccus acidiphilus TaxID=1670455 RepID=A0A348B2V5_9CREN|nr:(2Fe-2S)-binding protein [Sulfodiicoccus acidiphilus]BBD72507.1 (2Fe-2S)-binding protein [Sulfodiicoccus acidiphilus]GGT94046.1 (2Fe-2S)-binding protein [Sulfodiicoccus acidiphilus]
MPLPVVYSKVHGRPRSVRDCEPGLPYTEEVMEGRRVNLCREGVRSSRPILRLRMRRKVLHWRTLRFFPSILERYSLSFNVPSHYSRLDGEHEVRKLDVDWLVIGGGTAGLSLLKRVGGVLVARDVLGEAALPWVGKPLLEELKGVVKQFSEHIIMGEYKGRFDEGLVVQSGSATIVVRAKNVAFANGSRFVPPLFPGNDLPGVASVRLYLKAKEWFKNPLFVGSSDDVLRAASLVGGKVIHRRGAAFFSRRVLEEAQTVGVEIIPAQSLRALGRTRVSSVEVDGVKFKADSLIYGVVRQPRLEAPANFGLSYTFYSKTHVYLPNHDLVGRNGNSLLLGGARGISDPITSALSAHAAMGDIDQFVESLRETESYLLDYYRGNWESSPSPYIFGVRGYICECEDLTYEDVAEYMRADSDVEFVKRALGVCTGSCQGKQCAFLLGSVMGSKSLITFRSPLTPLVIP